MHWKCFFKGHEHDNDGCTYDPICSRCGMHDYYNSIQADPGCRYASVFNCYEFTIPHRFYIVKWWFTRRLSDYFHKCSDCEKPDKRFGFNVGDHSNCLPF